MARFPAIPADERTPTTNFIEQSIRQTFSQMPSHLEWHDASGALLGTYASLPYTEDLAKPWFNLAFAITRQERFTIKERERVILAVLTEYDAPYDHELPRRSG
ncbi:hypothetical protein ABOM_010493 [Aspergillus bombycis]|uniref:Uncharacterized protein n=1 Tax=Aspergillus bombycis TaxID=109264 RepID=A0A1F7ZNE4_9EURO|nr:hypothetical protein ABOM_010493 [Aspergillus bombycis]OGM40952.1 hypothetical protein ABOM_010493 [Aspergillus bombycis]